MGTVTEFPGLNGYAFTKDDDQIWVLWSPDQKPHTISLPSNALSVYDKFGEDITPENGELIIDSPIYVNLIP